VTDAEVARAAADRPASRGTLIQRIRAGVLAAVSWLACRLPERPQVAIAEVAGELAYRLARERAARARRNLRRVVRYLVAEDLANPRVTAAAADPRALERLVRAAFRHHARYYLEILRAPSLNARVFDERLLVENPETVDAVLAETTPSVFISAHFGPIELPGLYLAYRSPRPVTAPMETVDDPALQGWFERTRSVFGVRIVGLREARRELLAAIRRNESVGLVADRDITGGGIEVPFFGAPAPIPIGPALLATETGAPIRLAGVWRTGRRSYRGRLDDVAVVREGPRRERTTATVAAEAAAFERMIAHAPEQWIAVFFPIWPDLEAEATGEAEAAARAGEPR
jgi:phosphatidylinositol dimannoside acyltransferase